MSELADESLKEKFNDEHYYGTEEDRRLSLKKIFIERKKNLRRKIRKENNEI
jgi:hypothetical protein